MEAIAQKECPAPHNMFQSFKCYSCNKFLCPECLKTHPCKLKIVRAEVMGHFLTCYDHGCHIPHEIIIWTYHVPLAKLETKSLKTEAYDQESILIQHVIYIMGGLTSMSNGSVQKSFNNVYAYDTRTKGNFTEKAPMLTKACANAICTTNDLEIFTVGGKNEGGYLNVCEKFDIKANKWKSLKPVSLARGNVSLGVYNCEKIYCIGGYNGKLTDIIESLDTKSEGNAWTTVNVTNVGKKFNPRNAMAIVQNPISGYLMLFGGCSDLAITQDVYEYDVAGGKISKSMNMRLKKAAAFIQRKPVLYGDCYYLFEYGRRAGIYKYSFKNTTVDRIKAKEYIGDDLWTRKIKNA